MLNDNPEGKAGEIEKVVGEFVVEGITAVMALPIANVKGELE